MDNSRNISGNTLGDNAMLNQGNFNITVNAASSDDKRKFLRNVSKTDPTYDKKRIQTLKGPFLDDLFRWVLDHKNFDRWRRGSSGIFWIKGDPGKGKTMLLCGIIDEFEKDPILSPSLSYFFCQATDSRINTPTAVVGGLIFAMLKRNEAILSQILATYEDQLEGPNAWFVLCEIFEAIIQNPPFEESVFVVDALDECMKDNSSLLRFIVRTSGHVRWLISSRNEKDIERELRSIQPPQILSLDHAEFISSSIEIYINSRIAEIEALKDDEELRIKTQKILKDKAADTFLWVALVVEQLRSAAHWQVEDVLQEVPEGLESLYALILDKASLNQSSSRWRKKGQDACQLLVSIVTTAERPLHLEELYTFMSYQWEHFKSTVNLHDLGSIIKDCGSIFSIRNDVVYFIHQSAKDYILKEKFPLGLRSQHLRMFRTSTEAMSKFLKYDIYDLKTPGIHINEIQPQILDPMAPIKYCCVFWAHHLFYCYPSAAESEQNADINTILIKFLKKTFLCWVESLALMRRLPHALDIFQKLNDLNECTTGKCGHEYHISQQELHLFIQDGYQFLIRSRETAENWPLQLYFSATAFERANSTIRDAFEESVHKHWGPSPIVLNVSHNQSSVLLRTFTKKFSKEEDVILTTLLFSEDSSLLYSLDSNFLTVTRVDTGILHAEIEVGEGAQLAIAPNSNNIILVHQNGKVEVWNMEDQRCIQEYALNLREDKPINDVIAISPNGDLIASFHTESNAHDATSQVKIWQTGMVVCDCLWDQSGRPEAAFSPNSELLALADQAGIRIHCTHTGGLIKYLKAHWRENLTWVGFRPKRCSIFSPDSRYFVAIGDSRYPWLWSTKTWKCRPLRQINEPGIRNISISPDSSFLGICSRDTLRLWMIETGECICKVAGPSSFMAFSPNWTKSMLVASQSDHGAVQIRRVDVSHDQVDANDTNYDFGSVVISPDSRFVAALHNKNSDISLWSGTTGHRLRVLRNPHGGYCCRPAFSPDSKLLAYGNLNVNAIIIWNVTTGEIVCELQHFGEKEAWLTGVRVTFSSDSTYLATGDHTIYIWHIDTRQCVYKHHFFDSPYGDYSEEPNCVISIAISPNLAYVAFSYGRLNDDFWRLEIIHRHTGHNISRDAKGDDVKLAFSSDSATLIFISKYRVEILETATGNCLQQFDLQNIEYFAMFDQRNDIIHTSNSTIRKTTQNIWKAIPSMGYSFTYKWPDISDNTEEAWIVKAGEKVMYLSPDFRPFDEFNRGLKFAISDSVVAFINMSDGIVIIKFPTQNL